MKRIIKDRDIRDDEIRVIGAGKTDGGHSAKKTLLWIAVTLAAAALVAALCIFFDRDKAEAAPETSPDDVPGLYEQTETTAESTEQKAFMSVEEISLSGVPMRIYTPVNARPSLSVGPHDMSDPEIVFIAQAADVRADNMEILGDFVLNGEKLAYGDSKWGWCSIIGGDVRMGCDKEPAALGEAIEKGGSFFRQYGLIADGKYVKDSNSKKYEAIRRAFCKRGDDILIIETLQPMSLPLFGYALEVFKVDAAVTLVGGYAYGFAVKESGEKIEFGDIEKNLILESTSYLVFTKPATHTSRPGD